MESSSTPTTWEWSPADIATGTTILILVLDEAATVKGPYDDIRRPARYTASQGPQCQTASTGDHKPIFTPLGRSPGQNGSYSHSGAVVRSPEPFLALPPPPAPAVISSLSLAVHDLIEHRSRIGATCVLRDWQAVGGRKFNSANPFEPLGRVQHVVE